MGSDLALVPIDALTVFLDTSDGGITTYNGGGDFLGVGAHFTLAGDHAGILLGVLPPILHIREESDKAVLRWCVERMRQELRELQPGGSLVAQQLATMMLVQALRLHLAGGLRGGVGWLFALADKRMRVAITAMHDDPGHRSTLQSLAERAGMSRTTFAVKFKETVERSPMDYLTHWRMLLAGDKLANSGDPISVIAQSLGYESESAFSTAFKRSWAVPQGNTAVAAIPRRLLIARGGRPHHSAQTDRRLIGAVGGSPKHPVPFESAGIPGDASQRLSSNAFVITRLPSGVLGRARNAQPLQLSSPEELVRHVGHDHRWASSHEAGLWGLDILSASGGDALLHSLLFAAQSKVGQESKVGQVPPLYDRWTVSVNRAGEAQTRFAICEGAAQVEYDARGCSPSPGRSIHGCAWECALPAR